VIADGLFVAAEIDGDAIDILGQFETLAAVVLGTVDHLASWSNRSMKDP